MRLKMMDAPTDPAAEARRCRAAARQCFAELGSVVSPEKRRELLDRMVELLDRAEALKRGEPGLSTG
jgi:hypothetical protein